MRIIESNIWGAAKDEINKNALNKNGDTFLGELNMNGNSLTNIADPQNDKDAANVSWVKNWQPPWTYTEGFPHEVLFEPYDVYVYGKNNTKNQSYINRSDKYYIINNGTIHLSITSIYGGYPHEYFNETLRIYCDNKENKENKIAEYEIKGTKSSGDEEQYIDTDISVKKGDIIYFEAEGDDFESPNRSISNNISLSVDVGNPYGYRDDHGVIIIDE